MFPSTLSTFNQPTATSRLNSPSHSALHNTVSSAVGQIEAVIGVEGDSSVVGTLEYFIKSPDSNGGGHVQTANKGGTGQTNYNKGDMLVATSSSVLSKLAVSALDGLALVSDSTQNAGMKWGAFAPPKVTQFSISSVTGTGATSLLAIWTKSSTLSYAVIEMSGAGGGGGRVSGGSGGGGGAGAYSKYAVAAVGLPLAASVIVGISGGSGGSASAGVAGGSTTFGSVLSVSGGSGGLNNGSGGAGGAASTSILAAINFPGQAGGTGNGASVTVPGGGGSNILGQGAAGGTGSNDGINGGGGAGSQNNVAAGNGGNGVIIIYEY